MNTTPTDHGNTLATRCLGDVATLFDVTGGYREAQAIARGIPGAVPGATTVGVIGPVPEVLPRIPPPTKPRYHELAVSFDGEDLPSLGLERRELERETWEMEVAFLGFMPGFPYLSGLPEHLATIPRRPVPRPRVPAGSFAVAGGFGGIYPASSPGGWQLLGRCSASLFDWAAPPYVLLQPGDRVRLVPTDDVPPLDKAERPLLEGGDLEVVTPGLLCLVEDLGRQGVGALGVPRAGAANELALRAANLAVGNEESAAAIELSGLARFRANREMLIVLAGDGRLSIDATERPAGMVAAAGPGQLIEASVPARAILAAGGGIVEPALFGSRSSDALSGLPPGALRAGDCLHVGPPPERARLRLDLPRRAGPVLRAIPGPDELGPGAIEALVGTTWAVDRLSDRTGIRLAATRSEPTGQLPLEAAPEGVPSHAVVPGAIQLPPGGQPVILGPDCGPLGGYAVAATVITADLWRLGELRPGDAVEISLVTLEEAAGARRELGRTIARSVSGWYPVRIE